MEIKAFKHLKKLVLLTVFIMCFQQTEMLAQIKENINANWFFQKGEVSDALSKNINQSKWQKVEIPHTFNPSGTAEIYRDQKEEVGYQGPAWYRKDLYIPQELKGKRLFLHFDGAYIDTDVYINGEKIGNHKGGYSAFVFEVTNKVKYGQDNLISVRVSNEYSPDITPLGGGYIKFGGITRPVSLIVKDEFCISPLHYASSGVYCKQLNISEEKAELEIETVLNSSVTSKGNYKIVCQVIDANKKVVAKETYKGKSTKAGQWNVNIPISVKNPVLWNAKENPALYIIQVDLYQDNKLVDTVTETTGFRYVSVDENKGFFLNGKSFPLYGIAIHQYYPGVGSAMHKEHFDEDLELMLDLGVNAVRLSHYPHSEYRLDLCDKYGIVAFSEMAFIKEFFGTEAFVGNCQQQVKEMIYQLYNHPSIAIWGLFNEIRYDTFKGVDGVPIVEGLNKLAKEIDASRPTCGVSWKAGKRNDVADISGWNRYQGWYWNAYPGGPNDFTWLDQMHEQFPNRKLGITEYGGGGAINHFDENRKSAPYNQDQFHPVDFYNYSHEEHWKEMKKRPWLWGNFIWTLTEFLVPKYDQGRASYLHDKGLVGENRIQKKDVYYFYKANWKKEPVFHLAYKQFDIRLKDNAEVTVYSNLDNATLKINGVDYGTLKNASYGIYRWNEVPLKVGENKIIVSSSKNGKIYEEKAEWYYIKDIHNNSKLKELVQCGAEWKTLFKEEIAQTKKKRGSGVPGEEVNASFNVLSDNWKSSDQWQSTKLPLFTTTQTATGNWEGKMVYLTKEFEVPKEGLMNPHIYLKQTAKLSTENAGRISIAIDGKGVLTLEEGYEDYRLIPILERLGNLKAGKHKISVIANTPLKGGILDIGLVDKIL
ncbi:glycoside hydrolase family 2 protein [Lutibacter citreus]|uniref:glycoside hydrolase family 2 protein n=1 Tax=Lutibacter citreus TaxID=2138210 RepID=UPI000DBE5A46|nr:glycoside hydrolase family 2 TIM barrel-domain containing protein [Lutibacter citreus]